MNPRTLSSALTFWMKCLFPAIWISMFGSATLALFLSAMHDHSAPSAPEWIKWQFLAIWIAGSVFILWGCAGLKKVRMDESGLLVSNFVKEVRIPFTDICDVTENRWINIHPVTIHLRRPHHLESALFSCLTCVFSAGVPIPSSASCEPWPKSRAAWDCSSINGFRTISASPHPRPSVAQLHLFG